ncbi:hypothetical protein M569_14442 [Genlisea aurea]|uniref:Uncharacterized protein n=1 Tax=Genlisea aurea TaxID=192259 RepID=S8DLJ7_9LAMI|nr:hypothetical protein M569_14442 [Genlisea aurea]
MGNSAAKQGYVILSDGSVRTFQSPTTAADLMLDYPLQAVVELDLDDFRRRRRRITPLPADRKLDARRIYAMLPIREIGKPMHLTPRDVREIESKMNRWRTLRAFSSCTGLIHFVAAGRDDVVSESLNSSNHRMRKSDGFDDIVEGRPEFLSRQISAKGWKPNLDPINETAARSKTTHWLFHSR